MDSIQRKIFRTTQDWHDFLANQKEGKSFNGQNLFELRKKCYSDIENLRGRPLIVYASKFVESVPQGAPNSIDLSDVDGFTDLINSIQCNKEIDILLHSPGGRPDATERLVQIIRGKFQKVHFLIPHSAYSAATMLALSGDSITLHPSAVLGPIDPQLDGIPARSIKRGFENIKKKITEEGPESLPAYIPLIEKYTIHLLEICEDSEKLSKELASEWLTKFMFSSDKKTKNKIKKAVEYLSAYDQHLLHSRPLSFDKLRQFNLKLQVADKDLSDLLWEGYILLNGFFNITPFVKLYESLNGISWGKQFQQVPMQIMPKQHIMIRH